MAVKQWVALLIVLVQGIFCQGEIFKIVKISLTLFVRKQRKRTKTFTNLTVHNSKLSSAL